MECSPALRYVCKSCLARNGVSTTASQSRAFSSPGLSQLRSRRLIAVHGQDAANFLQGLTTANVPTSGLLSSPSNPQVLYSAFMNAQGRLLHDVFIYPLHPQHSLRRSVTGDKETSSNPAFLVEVDATQTQRLSAVLKKYKLRAKVDIRIVEEDEILIFAAWSNPSESMSASTSSHSMESSESLITQDPRIPGPWHRALASRSGASSIEDTFKLEKLPEYNYKIQRYLQGIPEGQEELKREETLLHEANIDLMHGVDFRKGCYVGQELVIRTQHTGVVRKRVMPVQIWTDSPPSAVIEDRDEPTYEHSGGITDVPSRLSFLIGQNIKTKGARRPDGKFLGAVGNLGLALCRLERVMEPGDLASKGKSKILELDLTPNDQTGVKRAWLRPFVPKWWEERGKIMEGGYESLKVRAPGSKG